MDIVTSILVIAFAALIHASFQLSVSVLILLGGQAIGARKSRAKIARLTSGFVIGAAVMTLLLLSFVALVSLHLFSAQAPELVWTVVCGVALGVGLAVWSVYYRRTKNGTELWIPRAFARHLSSRSQATNRSIEAFSLGLTSVVAEVLFLAPCVIIAALVLTHLPSEWQLAGLTIYTVLSQLGLLIVWVLIGSGTSISKIQKWRQQNKRFLQFTAGGALIVLGFFVYVSEVMVRAVGVQ